MACSRAAWSCDSANSARLSGGHGSFVLRWDDDRTDRARISSCNSGVCIVGLLAHRSTDSVQSGSDQENGARINTAARRDTFRSAKRSIDVGAAAKVPRTSRRRSAAFDATRRRGSKLKQIERIGCFLWAELFAATLRIPAPLPTSRHFLCRRSPTFGSPMHSPGALKSVATSL